MSKLVDIGLAALLGGGLVVGAYMAGKTVERTWWRDQLASRNKEVAAIMSKLGEEADGLDARLLEIIEADRAKLEEAEQTISSINSGTSDTLASDGICRPVPAHCLRRADGGAQASHAAARGSDTAR